MSREEFDVSTFLNNRRVLVIGANDAVSRALVEKILKSCDPWLVNLFLHEPDEFSAKDFSLSNEMKDKLLIRHGNLMECNLGLCRDDIRMLTNGVTVVFHIGVTDYKASLSDAIRTNLGGTRQVLRICQEIENLEAFLHVSTAFCIKEDHHGMEEILKQQPIDPEVLLELSKWMNNDQLQSVLEKLNVFPNSFVLTKALSEELVVEHGQGLPVAIVRPTIISEKCGEALNVENGRIVLPTAEEAQCMSLVTDVVPAVGVANILLVVAWHLTVYRPATITIYHCTGALTPSVSWTKAKKFDLLRDIPGFLAKRGKQPPESQKPYLKTVFQPPSENLAHLKGMITERDKSLFNINLSTVECNLADTVRHSHQKGVVSNLVRYHAIWKLLVFCCLWRKYMVNSTPASQIFFMSSWAAYLLFNKMKSTIKNFDIDIPLLQMFGK